MKRRKDPPGYPGDEAVLKALGDALRDIRIEKGMSLEQADAAFPRSLETGSIPAAAATSPSLLIMILHGSRLPSMPCFNQLPVGAVLSRR